jgi:Xaa-Pro dipeptidase
MMHAAPNPGAPIRDTELASGLEPSELLALRDYRYRRVQERLRAEDCAAALLLDPVNIRYATDSRNMAVWTLHNMARYCLVPAQGPAVLFEFPGEHCRNMASGLPAIGEVRPARIHSFFDAGEHAWKVACDWAAEIADLIKGWSGNARARLAVDRADLLGARALGDLGLELVEGQRIMELARSIKSRDELRCMRLAIAVCEAGVARMSESLRPGISENALWAELHYANIALGGEWIETRLLSSGPRTNPWFQESSERIIAAGDVVSFDTDLIGPYGYCADVSRTFFCGPGRPTPAQRELYALASEQVQHNCELLRPGIGFREYAQRAWRIPGRFAALNYGAIAHGVGLADEWPLILIDPTDPLFQDGVMQPGMTICVESYIGEVGGPFGVKLEQQVLITEAGFEILSRYPLEDLRD